MAGSRTMLRAQIILSALVTAFAGLGGDVSSPGLGETYTIIPAMNGSLASFIDESPFFSLATRRILQHFREVQGAVKLTGTTRTQGECAQGPQGFIHTIFHL